jgi:hypothetical protein
LLPATSLSTTIFVTTTLPEYAWYHTTVQAKPRRGKVVVFRVVSVTG